MNLIEAERLMDVETEKSFCGNMALEEHASQTIKESTKIVDKNTGETVCIIIKEAMSKSSVSKMYNAIKKDFHKTYNRGTSSGQKGEFSIKKDGTISRTHRTKEPVESSIIGFFDRYPRINYCRKTAFTEKKPEKFKNCLPYLVEATNHLKENSPERYSFQKKWADATSPDFVIPGTVFTTVTINRNFRTAYHQDAGDLKGGMGCLGYFKTGKFVGGDLIIPAYGLSIQLRHRDLLLFNPHLVHGNTEINPISEKYERITIVMYYRKKMIHCGTCEEELKRAKRNSGDQIIGPTTEDLNKGRWGSVD